MPGQDLLGAVELFQQQRPGEQVRPGHRAERQHGIGARDNRGTETVGAADREGERAGAAVAPAREPVGKDAAGPRFAPLVERDKSGADGQRGEDQPGLAQLELGSRQAALFFELDDRRRR